MSKEALVGAVKGIMAQARGGDTEGSYEGYRGLFASADFTANTPADQRQALKLLVLQKRPGTGAPSDALKEAHRAALGPLTELVSAHNEPEDYEMLGICHLMVGNEEAASNLFRQGLTLERERNPASDLCGRLMTRVASI
jgi:hypothetical protein